MAPFDHNKDELLHGLPWQLMQNGPVTMYWQSEFFEADIASLERIDFAVPRFDCATWQDEQRLFADLKTELELPEYTGSNWDALDESLTEVNVPIGAGMVVALDNFDMCPQGDLLLQVLAGASRWWLLFGRIFAIALRTNDPAMTGPDGLGGTRPSWNRHEQLTSSRRTA